MKIPFLFDNIAVVDVINKQSAKEHTLIKLLRRLMLVSMQYNIHLRAKYVSGKSNVLADRLCRSKFQEPFGEASYLAKQPTHAPCQLLTPMTYDLIQAPLNPTTKKTYLHTWNKLCHWSSSKFFYHLYYSASMFPPCYFFIKKINLPDPSQNVLLKNS